MSINPKSTDASRAWFHGEPNTAAPALTTTTARLLAMVGRDKVVLELGGDAASLSTLLTASGCRVTSVQPHTDGRDRAEPYCERVIVGHVEQLDLESELGSTRFDVVLTVDLLTRVKDPGGLLRKVTRLLEPCGCIVAGVPNVAHVSVRLAMLAGRSPYDGVVTNPSHLRFYTREILTRLFDDAGLTIARLERQEDTVPTAQPDLGAFVMPDLIEVLRKDSDANTSHFLVAAYSLGSPAGDALRIAVNELREDSEELKIEAVRAARTIEELRIEVCGYQREIEQRDDAVRVLSAQASRRDELVQSLSLQLDQHRAELSRMTGLLEQSQAERNATAAELDRHRVEVAATTDRLERECAEAAEARVELATQHEDAVRALNAEVLGRDEIVQSLSLQLDQHRAELDRMTRSLEQSRVEVTRTTEQLEQERGEARAAFARLEPELVATCRRTDALGRRLERERVKWERKIARKELALLEERRAVASMRENVYRVAAEAAALRDSRAIRVARWLRGEPDLWERVPARLAALKHDAIKYGFRRNGYALRESGNLQKSSICYPLPVRLNGVRAVALQVIVPAPGCGGVIGAELIAPSNDVVARATLSLDLVSGEMPTVFQFCPTDLSGHGWTLRVFVADSRSPVRILEFQRHSLPIQRALVRRPFCSILV